MSDLSKIKVGSTTYNIKDAQAREDLATQSSQIATKVSVNQGSENEGKLLGIDAQGNVIPVNAPETYEQFPTEETRIGTWIDGKPIYRKLVQLTLINGENAYAHGISNLKMAIRAFGVLNDTILVPNIGVGYAIEAQNNYSISVVNVTTTTTAIYKGPGRSENMLKLFIDYTKTTD